MRGNNKNHIVYRTKNQNTVTLSAAITTPPSITEYNSYMVVRLLYSYIICSYASRQNPKEVLQSPADILYYNPVGEIY